MVSKKLISFRIMMNVLFGVIGYDALPSAIVLVGSYLW